MSTAGAGARRLEAPPASRPAGVSPSRQPDWKAIARSSACREPRPRSYLVTVRGRGRVRVRVRVRVRFRVRAGSGEGLGFGY